MRIEFRPGRHFFSRTGSGLMPWRAVLSPRFQEKTMKASIFIAAAVAAFACASTTAFAGECPAGKERPTTELNGPTMPSKVTDVVIGSIDLGPQYKVADRLFRLRRLEIMPGGVVPQHSHGERPAHIYVVQGSIVEHRSTCAVPITHKAGDNAVEGGELTHWWKNESKQKVVLISADILPPAGKPAESM
jgi:quercetin dioxygenase-like cupin family protein